MPELYVLLCLGLNFVDFKQDFYRGSKVEGAGSEVERLRVREACHTQEHQQLKFASDSFGGMGRAQNQNVSLRIKQSLEMLLASVRLRNHVQRFQFNLAALKIVQDLFQQEKAEDLSLYRCFDSLDNSLGLEYTSEIEGNPDSRSTQRLFWGSGVSVQSSFSNIFSALQILNPKLNASLIDLGCGFGRWGLILGLLRTDMKFIGYEFVPSRVEAAVRAKESLGLSSKVQFVTQDLSDPKFVLPEADYYYMYDPFDQTTYQFLMNQILEISRTRKLSVITKGHASDWFQKHRPQLWQDRVIFDGGNLHVFSLSADVI